MGKRKIVVNGSVATAHPSPGHSMGGAKGAAVLLTLAPLKVANSFSLSMANMWKKHLPNSGREEKNWEF